MTPTLPTVPDDALVVTTHPDPDADVQLVDWETLTPGYWDVGADGRIHIQMSINGNLSYITFTPAAMLACIAAATARGRR